MIITKLKGGMGNQMFQYALGRNLAIARGTQLKLDTSFFQEIPTKSRSVKRNYDLDIFNIVENFASKEEITELKKYEWKDGRRKFLHNILRADKTKCLKEKQFNFDETVLQAANDIYLEGYWQSEKYFKKIESVIRQDFSFKKNIAGLALEMLNKIKSSNAVMLNIRRTDYLNIKGFNIIDANYIYKGIKILETKIHNPHYFLFSDDMEWCKKNIKLTNLTFVDHKYAGGKFDFYLQLMTNCKHFIIPNSTFAWWGAWLNKNPNKIVIAPKKWFVKTTLDTKDLIPNAWIRI